jgi:hypothetical protein
VASAAAGPSAPALATVAHSPGLGAHTFVGRDRELAEIEALLTGSTDVQLRATLDGLPGIGKTELARQVVARLARGKQFPGGIFWFNAEHTDLRLQWSQLAEDAGGPTLPDLDARARWAVRQVEHARCDRRQQEERIEIADPLYEELVAQGKATRIDFEESCKLAYKHGGMRRIVVAHVEYQVVGKDGETAIDIAPMPLETFPRSLAAPSLLVRIPVDSNTRSGGIRS